MPDTNKRWMVSFDTDRIKDYIFATNSLKEIRGASAILLEIEEQRPAELENSNKIYGAGGGGAYFAEDEESAEALTRRIETEFREKTETGSITAIWVEGTKTEDNIWYKALKSAASRKMQQKKSSKAELAYLPLEPYMRPCASCGQLPAEKRFNEDRSGDLLCLACCKKRETGSEERYEGYLRKFKEHIGSSHAWLNARLPKDLNELGKVDGSGYVGFIKIDGNRMGMLFDEIHSPEQDENYSKELKTTIEELVYDALLQHGKINQGVLPFEIVLIGGDDLMLFTTAQMAMPVTIEILRRFEEVSPKMLENARMSSQKLSMSAGVVLCHSNFPIPALADIGEDLLKNAKKKASPDYDCGVIDFQVVTGSMIDLESARAVVPYHRPYTHLQMSTLLQYARNFKNENMPNSQLQMVYEACMSNSTVEGTMAALRMVGRLRDLRQQQLLKEFFTDKDIVEFKGKEVNVWPWSRPAEKRENGQGEKLFSAFVDLLDLYRFVEKGD